MLKMLKMNEQNEEDNSENEDISLKTHTLLNDKFSGKVDKLKEGFAEIHLDIISEMFADEQGLIHNGFMFSAASFAATSAINEKYGFVIGAVVNFLSPVRQDDRVIFKAKSRQKLGRKRVVDVIGRVGDIKVFVGEFSIIIMDKHILNVKLDEIDVSEYEDEDGFDV